MARLTTNQERLIKERNVFGVTLSNALVDSINSIYDGPVVLNAVTFNGNVRVVGGFSSQSTARFANSAVDIHSGAMILKSPFTIYANNFDTGSVQLGSTRTAKWGFFGAAATALPTAVTAPAGVTANFKTSINGIISRLQRLGLMSNTA